MDPMDYSNIQRHTEKSMWTLVYCRHRTSQSKALRHGCINTFLITQGPSETVILDVTSLDAIGFEEGSTSLVIINHNYRQN